MFICPACNKFNCKCDEKENSNIFLFDQLKEKEKDYFGINEFFKPEKSSISKEPIYEEQPCWNCRGRGSIPDFHWCGDWHCFTCNGTGKVSVRKSACLGW